MKLLINIFVANLISVIGFSQSGAKLEVNIAEYIDSMETHIIHRVDTMIKYVVYGYHGEAIQHSFPIRLSLDKSKDIVNVKDLRPPK